MNRKRKLANPETLDWSKPSLTLSRETGISVCTLQKYRKRLGLENYARPSKWKTVDWSKTNEQIAEEMGVRLSSVTVKRSQAKTGWKAPRKKPPTKKQTMATLRVWQSRAISLLNVIQESASPVLVAKAAAIFSPEVNDGDSEQ